MAAARDSLAGGEAVADTLRAFVDRLTPAERDELADDVLRAIQLGTPELPSDEDAMADVAASTRVNVQRLIDFIGRIDGEAVDAPYDALALAHSMVRRGIDIDVLLKLYRLGVHRFWQRWLLLLTERHEIEAAQTPALLARSWDRVNGYLEAVIEQISAEYAHERERWIHGAAAQRSETVRAIVAGERLDPDLASRRLGYELRRHHTALVLWVDRERDGDDPLPRLEQLAQAAARALGAERPLALPGGARALWAWIGTEAPPELSALDTLGAGRFARIAVGGPEPGPAGFRASHREALAARRVAEHAADPAPLTHFSDVAVVSLLGDDEEAQRRFVARELGALAADDASAERLRATARVFLACGGSAPKAAARLGTHRNTVLYRLRRVEDLLGRSLEERRMELALALMLADLHGPRALPLHS